MGRLWLKNHNLHYSSYFFEETLFTPWYKGSLLSQTTCFAHGKVGGSSDYFWLSAIVSWRNRSMNSIWSGRSLLFCTTSTE